tara:strand:- start:4073 stop:5710 length:1638 start_codon:yes stop_codon:yes gene_type:complete
LIKNGKYFVEPQQTSENFKVLFIRLAAEGAGRPVDENGFADGSWTPETLTQAISELEGNQAGIELRTVQVWFHDNLNGISTENIKWLARIFGCNDPDCSSQWQVALSAAKERLAVERREKRSVSKAALSNAPPQDHSTVTDGFDDTPPIQTSMPTMEPLQRSPKTLAERVEWTLSGAGSINLIVTYWLVFCGLGFMNSILGTLSVTYSPTADLSKQVGFIWAPTLTILPLIALPLYILFSSNLITYWRRIGRPRCVSDRSRSVMPRSNEAWFSKVNDFSFSFQSIIAFCILFVCGFQLFFIYFPAYLSGTTNGVQIDRFLIALVRPDVISIPEAMVLTAVGYLYTASYISVFMFGLLFIVIIVLDYHDICRTLELEDKSVDRLHIHNEGRKIIWGSFRIAVLGLWLALLLKLQIAYLSSDSEDFVSWMTTDILSVFGTTTETNGWLDNTSITNFTTFLMVVVTVTVFLFAAIKAMNVFPLKRDRDSTALSWHDPEIIRMIIVIALVSATLLLVGRFEGFSLLVGASIVASLHVLSGPKLHTFLGG